MGPRRLQAEDEVHAEVNGVNGLVFHPPPWAQLHYSLVFELPEVGATAADVVTKGALACLLFVQPLAGLLQSSHSR